LDIAITLGSGAKASTFCSSIVDTAGNAVFASTVDNTAISSELGNVVYCYTISITTIVSIVGNGAITSTVGSVVIANTCGNVSSLNWFSSAAYQDYW